MAGRPPRHSSTRCHCDSPADVHTAVVLLGVAAAECVKGGGDSRRRPQRCPRRSPSRSPPRAPPRPSTTTADHSTADSWAALAVVAAAEAMTLTLPPPFPPAAVPRPHPRSRPDPCITSSGGRRRSNQQQPQWHMFSNLCLHGCASMRLRFLFLFCKNSVEHFIDLQFNSLAMSPSLHTDW